MLKLKVCRRGILARLFILLVLLFVWLVRLAGPSVRLAGPAARTSNDRNLKNKKDKIKRKLPKGSVVSIRGKGEDFSYASALKRAREEISLDELGIENSRIRKAASGGLLIEISGMNSGHKADLLATCFDFWR